MEEEEGMPSSQVVAVDPTMPVEAKEEMSPLPVPPGQIRWEEEEVMTFPGLVHITM